MRSVALVLIVFYLFFAFSSVVVEGHSYKLLCESRGFKLIVMKYGFAKLIVDKRCLGRESSKILGEIRRLGLRIREDNESYLIEFNMFSIINRSVASIITSNERSCLSRVGISGNNFTLRQFLEILPPVRILRDHGLGGLVRISYMNPVGLQTSLPNITGHSYVIGVNDSLLDSIKAVFLPSRFGLPRLDVINIYVPYINLGDFIKLDIVYNNYTAKAKGIRIPVIVNITLQDFEITGLLPGKGSPQPRVLAKRFRNSTSFISLFFNTSSSSSVIDAYLVAKAIKAGKKKILVDIEYLLGRGEKIILHRYVLGSLCGFLEVDAPYVSREQPSYPPYFTVAGVLLVLFSVLYLVRGRRGE